MSSMQDDHYADGDRTVVRDSAPGQHERAPGQQMPAYAQQQQPYQQPYAQQPYQQPYGYGAAQGYGYGGPSSWGRPRRQFPIETKPFFLTSEFVGAVLAIIGIAMTAAASDAFGAWRAWILITAVVVGYMVSRGIAKSGTRSHSDDPRENLDLSWGRGDSNHEA